MENVYTIHLHYTNITKCSMAEKNAHKSNRKKYASGWHPIPFSTELEVAT